MSEEREREEKLVETDATDAGVVTNTRVEEMRRPAKRANRTTVVAIVAVVGIAALAVALWLLRPGQSGRPVPAPRTITVDQTANQATGTTNTAEPTLTIAPEQVQRAGI